MCFTRIKNFLLLPILLLMAACGGAGDDPSSNSPVAGVGAVGTGYITGFGSVIVDGIAYDDTALDNSAAIQVEADDASVANGNSNDLKLGQRTHMEFNTGDFATSVQVASELVGTVTDTLDSNNTLEIAGQRVSINNDSTAGPVTMLAGFTNVNDLQLGERLEVHGLLRSDSSGPFIQASRIELQPLVTASGVAITRTKITGFVSNLVKTSIARTFTLGNLTVTVPASVLVSPTNTLNNGDLVKVFSATAPVIGNSTANVTATSVHTEKLTDTRADFRMFGIVSNLNATAKTFNLDNVPVNAVALTALPANGQAVRVEGAYNAGTGILAAKTLKTSDSSVTGTLLRGSVTEYSSDGSFKVRGTQVDASTANVSNGLIADGAFVEVNAIVDGKLVVASTVAVKTPGNGSQLSLTGTVSGINTGAQTFTLNGRQVAYGSIVSYDNGTVSDLIEGKLVTVQGRLLGNVLQANTIEFDNAVGEFTAQGVLRSLPTANGSFIGFVVDDIPIQCQPLGNIPSSTALSTCNTSQLRQGVRLKVKYTQNPSNNRATRIQFDD